MIPVNDEGTCHMFKYRFNDSHATDEQLQFRRTRTDVITHADGSEQPCATSTYSAIVPLERTEVISPFLAVLQPTAPHQLPTTNYQPPTTDHRPPTTNHQPPTTNHQPPRYFRSTRS